MRTRRITIVVLGAFAGLGVCASMAGAAKVKNGDFERGNLSGWQRDFSGAGFWEVYEGPFGLPRGPMPAVPAPPQGDFGAITQQGDPSRMFLSQVVKLKPDKRHKLKFKLAYAQASVSARRRGSVPGFSTPNHFRFDGAVPNQQFRMDVMKPRAPIASLKQKHVLDRVYRTDRGDPDRRPYRTIKANLTDFAGDKVRLRFAVVVTERVLNVGIDAVEVKTRND